MDRRRLLVHLLDQLCNPAVTIARMLSDTFAGIAPASAPMFILMQLIGVIMAFGLVSLFYPHNQWETPDE